MYRPASLSRPAGLEPLTTGDFGRATHTLDRPSALPCIAFCHV